MTDWTSLIGQVFFPIVMCAWFMLRMEKVINENTRVTREVRDMLAWENKEKKINN